jgi:type IV secretion system protein VirB10
LAGQQLLLAKGATLDCTLLTAIDSTLPGFTKCVTATDTWSADGSVVLLKRGSQLFGETRGQVEAGKNRLFIVWAEARTPEGIVVPLASPGTDPLGRAGVTGQVDRHFWSRFGSAILVSVVDGAVQGIANSQNRGGVVINPSSSRDVATEILRETMRVRPTLRKNQGDRVAVLVARDVDFRGVHAVAAE